MVKPEPSNELIILKLVGILIANLISKLYGRTGLIQTPNPLPDEDESENYKHKNADQEQNMNHSGAQAASLVKDHYDCRQRKDHDPIKTEYKCRSCCDGFSEGG